MPAAGKQVHDDRKTCAHSSDTGSRSIVLEDVIKKRVHVSLSRTGIPAKPSPVLLFHPIASLKRIDELKQRDDVLLFSVDVIKERTFASLF